jgi:hypothetical protein
MAQRRRSGCDTQDRLSTHLRRRGESRTTAEVGAKAWRGASPMSLNRPCSATQPFEDLVARLRGEEPVRAWIGMPVDRFHRHVQKKLVTRLASPIRLWPQFLCIGHEGKGSAAPAAEPPRWFAVDRGQDHQSPPPQAAVSRPAAPEPHNAATPASRRSGLAGGRNAASSKGSGASAGFAAEAAGSTRPCVASVVDGRAELGPGGSPWCLWEIAKIRPPATSTSSIAAKARGCLTPRCRCARLTARDFARIKAPLPG